MAAMAEIAAAGAAAAEAAAAGLGLGTALTAIPGGGSRTALLLAGLAVMLDLIAHEAAATALEVAETARLEVGSLSGGSKAAVRGHTVMDLAGGAMVLDGGTALEAREPVVQASVTMPHAVDTTDLTSI